MSMQVAAVGSSLLRGTGPQHEFPQEPGTLRRSQARAEERRAAALAKFESSLPGTDIHSASLDLEQISLAFNKRLKFSVDHESHDITVKVIDRETDKVIKVLPPEELQRMHAKIRETIGFLFDEKV